MPRDTELEDPQDLRAGFRKFLNLTNERKNMSTKTNFKRVALVAVAALGLGVLTSVAPANAATGDMTIGANGPSADVTAATCTSFGMISGTGAVAATATPVMYDSGTMAILLDNAAAKNVMTISGGTFTAFNTVAGGTDPVLTGLTIIGVDAADGDFCVLAKPNAAGTPMVIKSYTAPTAKTSSSGGTLVDTITTTVSLAANVGVFSASKSNIAITAAGGAPAATNIDTAGANTVENGTCVYLYYDLKDANSTQLSTSTSIIGKVTSGFTVGIGATGTIGVVTGSYGGAATYLKACQSSSNKASTGTLTLTVAGVDVATRTITIVGQLASITVSADAIAKRNDDGTTDAVYGDFTTRNAGTWYPSHSYTAKDAAGNAVPVTVSIDTTTLDAQVYAVGDNGSADPRNADADLRTGGLTFACADTSGANAKVKVKATAADGITSISSNEFTVTCAGNAVNYTASTDKAVYNTGDVMTVTVKGTDKSGKVANDYGIISTTAKLGTIASGAIGSAVSAPKDGDTFASGVATYKYVVGQTEGTYTMAVDFPVLNSVTYNQSALTIPITVKSSSTAVSNADVLKAIVSLIASINKQIAALQKALLKK